jgi:hypothetical protein
LKMTDKKDPSYAGKAVALKKIQGRHRESHKRFQQHVLDHGCR